ncbi:MAG: HAMP domain-containing histidine kinase [Pseudobdellovibrionaceae bacterium]|nr:HAMP domain-containing histidine kinase [Pseudobdellovibrionaceae bacterium]
MTSTPSSSDQQLDLSKYSAAGQWLVRSKDRVIEEWEKRIRAELKGARNLEQPILVNTIPSFLDNLAEALTPDHPRTHASEFSTLAQEHGGERARLTFYNPDELIREYQVLKDTLIETLDEDIRLTREDRLVISHSIDVALREAATTFALVQADIREQFVATLTHDLRNPIGVIKMAAELTCDELDNPAEARTLLALIIANAQRADRMIQDLLDTTVIKSGGRLALEISECNMLDIVESVTRDLAVAAGSRFKVTGESIHGFWSAEALRRALENLCTNAIKYGDSATEITIQMVCTHGRIIVSVHNEGLPIPAEEQEAIFQVYRRAHAAKRDNKKGWGLGLALVRGVAESHGGSLAVDSQEGQGTTFLIDIPQDARPYQTVPISETSDLNHDPLNLN